MEIKEENNSYYFINEMTNDLTIHLNDKQIKVNKSVLISESDYFKAMFENQWFENNNNCVKLEETLIKPFINVIKLCYGFDFNAFRESKISEIDETIIIANKYQFNRIEKLLSKKVIEYFPSIKTDFNTLSLVLDLFEMSKDYNLIHLNNECLNYIDENANEIIKTFDKLFISPEMLHLIIIRDSFGVKEIDLFNALMNWISKTRRNFSYKYYSEEQKLLEAIRFEFISSEDIEKRVKPAISQLFSTSIIDDIFKDLFEDNSNHNKRVCIQPEITLNPEKSETKLIYYDFKKNISVKPKQRPTLHNVLNMDEVFDPQSSVKSCELNEFKMPLNVKISCIEFQIIGCFLGDRDKVSVNYIIEVRDIEAEDKDKWNIIIDYTKFECNGFQQLFFDEIITDSIRIIRTSSERRFQISSFSCQLSKNPLKLHNCIVRPMNDIIPINVTKCWLRIGSFTQLILKEKFGKYSKILINQNFKPNSFEFQTHYYIIFSQPFAINSFQFDVKLETDDSSVKYKAVFEVSIISDTGFDSIDPKNDTKNWVKVCNDLVNDSLSCNVAIDLQTVSAIKISGFQLNTDKQSKIPLHISGIRVPVNRETNQWICGKTLSLSVNNNDINEMLALLH